MWVEPDFSALRFFFLSLNSLFLIQDLTRLRGGPKTASGKESLSSSYKGFLAGAFPSVTQRLEMQLPDPPEAPKAVKSLTQQPCLWKTDNQIFYASFMVSVA
jgi:hypothetical protein